MTWHDHKGGADPLHNPDEPTVRQCRVKFRNGVISKDVLASRKWRWPWGGRFPKDSEFDIVGYEEVT